MRRRPEARTLARTRTGSIRAVATPSTRDRLFRVVGKSIGGLHRSVYRATGGRIGGHFQGMSILLLTTTGRKTGQPRTNPLAYVRDGDNIVVIASNGGQQRSPAWWLNLKHTPTASIEIGRERQAVTARRALGDEHTRLWNEVTGRFPAYAKYQQKTTRQIPVVILEPARSAGSGGAASNGATP